MDVNALVLIVGVAGLSLVALVVLLLAVLAGGPRLLAYLREDGPLRERVTPVGIAVAVGVLAAILGIAAILLGAFGR